MAVKIVRQPKKIALIGAPSSAAAFLPGSEKAPAALRAAGLVERLQAAGYEVIDHGDCAPRLFADDEEHRRARNLTEIVAGLNDLKARAEVAIKSGALVLVLGGDCAQVIGLLAGSRRYYKHINLFWFDRDADLNTPATTPSGRIDGMVVAHIIGKGAPELVRFFGESALVREPDVLLFGLQRVDPPEQEFLTRSPMRHVYAADVQLKGAAKSAADALAHLHADAREFILHLDTDVIAQEDFSAVNLPDSGGLRIDDVRIALKQIVRSKNLLGFDVAQYNPVKDPDGSGAKTLVDLIVEALVVRLESADVLATEATLQEAVGTKAPVETRAEPIIETHATGSTTTAVPQAADESSDGQSTDERPSAETPSNETSA